MNDSARDWCIRWGIWAVVVAAFLFSLLIDALSVYYRVPILGEISRAELVQYKLTFLSVWFIAGTFRYNYFYSEAEQMRKELRLNDFGPGWTNYWLEGERLRRILASRADAIDPETEAFRVRLRAIDAELELIRAARMNDLKNWLFEGGLQFGVIFSMGVLLLVSLWLDLLILLKVSMPFYAELYSQSSFFTSLALFSCLFVIFLISFNREIRARNT